MTGDLGTFMNFVSIPGANTESFVAPSARDRDDFREAISLLLSREYAAAALAADGQGYDLIEFSDVFSDLQPYYIFAERAGPGFRGLGTYVFNPAARRALSIQAPHVPSDHDTGPQSVDVFLSLDAAFWQINGTHRCANAATGCSGTTGACGGDNAPFRESDVAHFTRNFFQVANDEVARMAPNLITLQFHSFSVCPGEDPDETPLAQLSNVSSADTPNSLATRLAIEISNRAANAAYTGVGAVSWNATEDDPASVNVPDDVCPEFSGGSNVQGRSLHGSPEPCTERVTNVPSPERFIHIEQRSLLTREGPGLPDHVGISRDIVIEAIKEEFPAPPQRWVRFAHDGLETGSYALPHDTLKEALEEARAGETIRIRTGSSNESGVFAHRVTLRGFDGRVTIGN